MLPEFSIAPVIVYLYCRKWSAFYIDFVDVFFLCSTLHFRALNTGGRRSLVRSQLVSVDFSLTENPSDRTMAILCLVISTYFLFLNKWSLP